MDDIALGEARLRITRWIEEGTSVLGVLPGMFEEHERLRAALEATEHESARLRQELRLVFQLLKILLELRQQPAGSFVVVCAHRFFHGGKAGVSRGKQSCRGGGGRGGGGGRIEKPDMFDLIDGHRDQSP